jgi:hypothetical protein
MNKMIEKDAMDLFLANSKVPQNTKNQELFRRWQGWIQPTPKYIHCCLDFLNKIFVVLVIVGKMEPTLKFIFL